MSILCTDAFTASDGLLATQLTNWTKNTTHDLDIKSNQLAPNQANAGEDLVAHRNDITWPNDQYAQIVCVTHQTGDYGISPAVRCHASAYTCYLFYSNDTTATLYKSVTGTVTQVGSSGSRTLTDGDVLYLEVQGTSLICKVNGTTTNVPGTQTDSAIASGSAGVHGYGDAINSTYRADSFVAGAFTANPINARGLERLQAVRRASTY